MDEKKFKKKGKKIERIGIFLILVLTIPIVLTLIFSILGLIIGIIIAAVTFIGMLNKKEKGREKNVEEKVGEMMIADSIRPQFRTKREKEEYEKLKREACGHEAYESEKKFNRQVKRNLMGIELEKMGKTDEAIKLYEQNVREDFEGSHPYNRLSIIYRKRGQFDEEIRILEKAILIHKDDGHKLEKFKERLEKVVALKSRK
jgi:tetratricopeptide (TPR) repeat protein